VDILVYTLPSVLDGVSPRGDQEGVVARTQSTHRAFTLIELLLVIGIIALLISILLPALGSARKTARTGICMANMRQYGTGLINYSTDARGSIAQFNWQTTSRFSRWAELNNHAGAMYTAHANQANDIIRRFFDPSMAAFNDLMLNRNFSYLVMLDGGYFGNDKLPLPGVVCPEDRRALIWAANATTLIRYPSGAASGIIAQAPLPPNTRSGGGRDQFARLAPFWSTYQMIPNGWSPERAPSGGALISQWTGTAPGDYDLYAVSTAVRFELRRMDQVTFPAQKVVMFDLFDRHYARRGLFHAEKQARQPLLMFDGSVNPRFTKDSNEGGNPNQLTNRNARTVYTYTPDVISGDPRPSNGANSIQVIGHYRWTFQGIRGFDFAGRQ
jgi:prepilin-type N-terminal cleavage/methylation domain-containing protein